MIVGKFDEFQIYVGKSMNMEGAYAFSYQESQEDEGPTFLFFADGLKEQKLWTSLFLAATLLTEMLRKACNSKL